MKIGKSIRVLLVSALALTLTVNCGGNEVEPAETTSAAANSSASQSDEEQSSESDNLLVSVLADELMNDPEIGGALSQNTAMCLAEWAVTTMGIEGLSDLDSLETEEDEVWMQGFSSCLDQTAMLALMIAEMGGTEEQAECMAESLGDETENVAALFNMNEEPESEEGMMFLFAFMAAAMDCGVDVMEGADLDLGEDDYESSASWETINDPMCPNGEPCICIDIDGSCDDGDDDWGWINNGEEEYFCSNDGKDYAEFMGGSLCAETPENA